LSKSHIYPPNRSAFTKGDVLVLYLSCAFMFAISIWIALDAICDAADGVFLDFVVASVAAFGTFRAACLVWAAANKIHQDSRDRWNRRVGA
jgi:hypothetical protein